MEALRPGALDCARYQHVAKFLKEQGLIKKNPQLKAMQLRYRLLEYV